MANEEQLSILKQGVIAWNKWRANNPSITPDLSGAEIRDIDFTSDPHFYGDTEVNFHSANLCGADFSNSNLLGAILDEANMNKTIFMNSNISYSKIRHAKLHNANLYRANLVHSDLTYSELNGAHLYGASLSQADFTHADLREADLREATIVETTFVDHADLSGAWVYGISVWGINIDSTTKQSDLIISTIHEPKITVDNLEVAQFVYLLLNNNKIKEVIDTIGNKAVLILGCFTDERKIVLDAIREKLRHLNFLPIVFDFEKPTQRDFTETVKTLAGMSRFIIADITKPKSSPLELQAVIPDYMVPFVPIIQENEEPFSMFCDLQQKYGKWVLDVLQYDSIEGLLNVIEKAIIEPAVEKANQLALDKVKTIQKRHVKDYE